MDGHGSSRCHSHHRCCSPSPFRLLSLPSLPLRPPRVSAPARCMIFVLGRSDPVGTPQLARLIRYFTYVASQSRNVLYQNWLFCGFKIQCPSSGKTTNFDGTPCPCTALQNSSDCVNGTR